MTPAIKAARSGRKSPGTRRDNEGILGRISLRLTKAVEENEIRNGINEALEIIRRDCDADAGELFLADPRGRSLLMCAVSSENARAFVERTRFPVGKGYPGLVFRDTVPIFTNRLADDGRFLRREIIADGFRSYLAVPIRAWGEIIGTVHLAWKSVVDSETYQFLLTETGRLIGAALASSQARWMKQSGLSRAAAGTGAEPGGGDHRREALERFVAEARAQSGLLVRFDERGRASRFTGTDRLRWNCLENDRFRLCDALRCGHAAGGSDGSCPEAGAGAHADGSRCCLPIYQEDRLAGAIFLEYDRDAKEESRRMMPLLMRMAESFGLLERGEGDREPSSPTADADVKPREARPSRRAKGSIEIRCFGGFELRARSRTISSSEFPRKKALHLLKILALHHPSPVSSFQLVEWLWPEIPEESSINRLYTTVHSLRSLLERGAKQSKEPTILRVNGLYSLNPEKIRSIDVARFRAAMEEGRRAAETGRSKDAMNAFKTAVDLYRGDLFEENLYDDWCAAEKNSFQAEYIHALEHLAAAHAAEGEPEKAARFLRAALRRDPLREDLHRALITHLLELGRRREARARYQECLWLLRNELGAEPQKETLELGKRCLARP